MGPVEMVTELNFCFIYIYIYIFFNKNAVEPVRHNYSPFLAFSFSIFSLCGGNFLEEQVRVNQIHQWEQVF